MSRDVGGERQRVPKHTAYGPRRSSTKGCNTSRSSIRADVPCFLDLADSHRHLYLALGCLGPSRFEER